jgi:multidrug efflux system membrane fusion protein
LIFTLPEDALSVVGSALSAGTVTVEAMSRDGSTELDRGTVTLIDNQIDQTTGTIRLKAVFPNPQNKLWPGQYVDARVLVRTDKGALTIPAAAVQRGPDGMFTYVVKADSTVEMRPLKVGEESGAVMVVQDGITEGERVVTSNQYRLQPGAQVKIAREAPSSQLLGRAAP